MLSLPAGSVDNDVWERAANLLVPADQIWRYDPVAWLYDNVEGVQPKIYQEQVMGELPRVKKGSVRAPHGVGKTTIAAWVVLWFADTREAWCQAEGGDWKIPTTAGAWRQLEHYLWPEIHKWAGRLKRRRFGRRELFQLKLSLPHGEAFAMASDDPALSEGAHADHILFLWDEAKAIDAGVFQASEGAFSTAGENGTEALGLMISTPGPPSGVFADIQLKRPGHDDWWVRHITLEEALEAGQISEAWATQRALQWGERSAVYLNRVRGEFATSDVDGVIPVEWLEAANQRWLEGNDVDAGPLSSVTVDVARSGEDKTVLASRHGLRIAAMESLSYADTMITTRSVVTALGDVSGAVAVVDVIGLGAGVVDRLRELGLPVEPFNAAEGSTLTDQSGELGFVNRRAAAWWTLRELLDPVNGLALEIPPDDQLTGDLTAPHWWVTSGGNIQVEPKAQIRQRLGRSTDRGDAVVMAYSPPEQPKGQRQTLMYDQPVTIGPRT